MAPMYGLPLQHIVGDVMVTERCSGVGSGYHVWRITTEIVGWDIPDFKSPPPSSETCLLGADVRHHEQGSELDIMETRVDTLEQLLLGDACSNAGAAGKLCGRLSVTSSQSHGKWGRAKFGPIKARQYDHHNKHLTNQRRAALECWLAALRNRVPRPVPLERLRRAKPVITYSDGEGASAGVGVVTFGGFPWQPATTCILGNPSGAQEFLGSPK